MARSVADLEVLAEGAVRDVVGILCGVTNPHGVEGVRYEINSRPGVT